MYVGKVTRLEASMGSSASSLIRWLTSPSCKAALSCSTSGMELVVVDVLGPRDREEDPRPRRRRVARAGRSRNSIPHTALNHVFKIMNKIKKTNLLYHVEEDPR